MTKEKSIEILEQTMMISPLVSIPSGRTSVDTSKFADKPPKEFSSHIPNVDSDRLKPLRKVRTDLESALELLGIKPNKNSYLIFQENWPAAIKVLQEHKARFDALKQEFLNEQDDANINFPSQFPGWEHIVEEKLLSSHEISYKFKFAWTAFAMTPAPESIVKPEDAGLEAMVDSFGDSLFHEIAVDARKSFKAPKDSNYGLWIEDPDKVKCTAKTLGPLRRISQKLGNLLLLHPSAVHIKDLVDDVINKLPPKGPYVGSDFMMIKGVLNVVTSEMSMEGYGKQVQQQDTSSTEFLDVWASKANDVNAPEAKAAKQKEANLEEKPQKEAEENDEGLVFDMPEVNLWSPSGETEEAENDESALLPVSGGGCVEQLIDSPF